MGIEAASAGRWGRARRVPAPAPLAGHFSLGPGRTLRLRWLGSRVAYRDAHALQRALWAAGAGGRRLAPAARAPARLHRRYPGAARAHARRPGQCRRGAAVGRPGRRHHLPRPRPAGRLPGAFRAQRAVGHPGLCPRGRTAGHRHLGPPRAARRRPARGYPGVWVGPTGPVPGRFAPSGPATAAGAPCTALLSTSAPDLAHVRPHRPLRDRRQGGHLAGGRRPARWPWPRSSRPSSPWPRERWGDGRPVERQDAAWQ